MSVEYSTENLIRSYESGIYFIDGSFNCFEGPNNIWVYLNKKKLSRGALCYYGKMHMVCIRINEADYLETYRKVIDVCRKEKIVDIVCPAPSFDMQLTKEIRRGIEEYSDGLNIRLLISDEHLRRFNNGKNARISKFIKIPEVHIKKPEVKKAPEKKSGSVGLQFSKGITLENLIGKEKVEILKENMAPRFHEQLFSLIDSRNMLDSEVYKRANIDKRLFSKIRCDSNYRPSKDTVIALCIALKLNVEESNKLLNSIGAIFSCSLFRDVVIKACIEAELYDIDDVNLILLEKGLKMLSSYK